VARLIDILLFHCIYSYWFIGITISLSFFSIFNSVAVGLFTGYITLIVVVNLFLDLLPRISICFEALSGLVRYSAELSPLLLSRFFLNRAEIG
jgi:hypothetical protein